jgi:hypothetical protein
MLSSSELQISHDTRIVTLQPEEEYFQENLICSLSCNKECVLQINYWYLCVLHILWERDEICKYYLDELHISGRLTISCWTRSENWCTNSTFTKHQAHLLCVLQYSVRVFLWKSLEKRAAMENTYSLYSNAIFVILCVSQTCILLIDL